MEKRQLTYWLMFLCCCASLFISNPLLATHIVGGEMNYHYLSDNTYEIKLTVYRDCGRFDNAPYDDVAHIGVFDQANNSVDVIKIRFTEAERIPLSINSDCADIPNGICYEYTYYTDTVVLPPLPGGYRLVYQRCCWNTTVTNIKNPSPDPTERSGSAGLTIQAKIPDVNNIPVNSNPIFQELTPPFICHGTEFEFNHEAIDPDGDSLAYRIITPYDAPEALGNSLPKPPPYQLVKYQSGYSLSNVMGGEPLKVDPATGFVTAKPSKIGQFVFAVEVLEYRFGVQIGSTVRSYQLNTDYCPDLTFAYIKAPDAICGEKELNFENESLGATRYMWNFGDSSNPSPVSQIAEPTYTFPTNGQYVVTLIAVSARDSVACNDTTQKTITLADDYEVDASFERDNCLNRVEFFGDASKIGNLPSNWIWKFGDGNVAYTKDAVHNYRRTKLYNITLVSQLGITHEGCVDSIELVYNAFDQLPDIEASASKYSVFRKADSAILAATSSEAIEYSWKPSLGLDDPKIKNPTAKPQETTTYIVTIKDAEGCVNRDTLTITVNPYFCGESEMYIPNAFTPNNDGENDYFRVRGEDISQLYLAVYNRWGQLVYESSDTFMTQDQSFGWDGTFNGEQVPSGVFVYYLKATCKGGNDFIKKGNVTLLR